MSLYFPESDGFCNCGNELLTWFELQDDECSTCSLGESSEDELFAEAA